MDKQRVGSNIFGGNFKIGKRKVKLSSDELNDIKSHGTIKLIDLLPESSNRQKKVKKKITLIVSDYGGELEKILNYLKSTGNAGHSHSIIMDADEKNSEKYFWDGDGSDKIYDMKIEELEEDD